MSPNLLRRLDRLVGLPICHVLTLWRRLGRRFRRVSLPQPLPQRVLLIQLAEAGSLVLADPILAALAHWRVNAFIVTFASNAPALRLTERVPPERMHVLRDDHPVRLLTDIWRFRQWVRAQRIDAVIDMELFSRLTAVLAVWSGVRRRSGFHDEAGGMLYRGHLFSDPVRFNPHIHMARNYLQLAEPLLGVSLDTDTPSVKPVRPTQAAIRSVDALLEQVRPQRGGRLVLVSPNASDRLPQRRWPMRNYVALIEQLLVIRPDVTVLLIGSDSDRSTTTAIASALSHGRCIDIAGKVLLEDLPALFEKACLLIGNDSGPAHFAAVSGLPVVVLFGPETPVLFAPLGPSTVLYAGLPCSPCVSPANQRKSSCGDNRCMQQVAVAQVLEASLAWLLRRPRRSAALPLARSA